MPKRRGRKPTGQPAKKIYFSVRLDEFQQIGIKRLAHQKGVDVSTLMRDTIDQMIADSGSVAVGHLGAIVQ